MEKYTVIYFNYEGNKVGMLNLTYPNRFDIEANAPESATIYNIITPTYLLEEN